MKPTHKKHGVRTIGYHTVLAKGNQVSVLARYAKNVLLCYREERRLPERSLRRRNWERAVERQSGGTLYLV